MASFLPAAPATSDRIDDLSAELVLSLELQRGEGCDLTATSRACERLIDAVHGVLVAAEDLDRPGTTARVDQICRRVESAYRHWKSVDAAFAQTLKLAYAHHIPRHNLLLDDLHATLLRRAGDPLAEVYTDLQSRWAAHVDTRPWDAHGSKAPAHVDTGALDTALNALAHGDDLDVEDAMEMITGPLRQAFAEHVRTHPLDVDDLELGLWKRPEMLVAGDYWGRTQSVRLIDVLAGSGSDRSRAAATTLAGFFLPAHRSPVTVVRALQDVHESHRERFSRCLMMHPDYEVRRFAAGHADANSLWKVLTPSAVPCASILTLLERMVGTHRYTTAQRKIFFDAVYRRLLSLTSRSDVLYARGIARICVKLNFFMEDSYFARLNTVLDYIASKEKSHGIRDGLLSEYITRLRSEKERTGVVAGEDPAFDGIPLVALRKLARDGHYWNLLVAHPVAKVARETVPHVSTRDRALVVANNHRVNAEVLRGLGRKRELFSTLPAKMALLSNPVTPVAVSASYVSDLTLSDVDYLLRRSTVHPELRHMLRSRYEAARR